MASKVPTVRQVSWTATAPQFIALLCAVAIGIYLSPVDGVFIGAGVYLAYSIGSRLIIPSDHRAGIALVKRGEFADAIPCFQRSLEFFDRHPWIDDYRSIVLMSPSAFSYREMALANIAFCYTQLGDGTQAREFYRQCLDRFPGSILATTALRMMDSDVSKKERTITTADDYFDAANRCELDEQWMEANEYYAKALELQPNFPEVYFNRADNWVQLDEYGKAMEDYRQLVSLAPDDSTNHEYFAQALLDEDNPHKDARTALSHAQHAYELASPLRHGVASTLAAALAANGRFEEAIKLQKQAIDLTNSEIDADVWQHQMKARLLEYENQLSRSE